MKLTRKQLKQLILMEDKRNYSLGYLNSFKSIQKENDIKSIGWNNYPVKEVIDEAVQIIESLLTEWITLIKKINQKIKNGRTWEKGHQKNIERYKNILTQAKEIIEYYKVPDLSSRLLPSVEYNDYKTTERYWFEDTENAQSYADQSGWKYKTVIQSEFVFPHLYGIFFPEFIETTYFLNLGDTKGLSQRQIARKHYQWLSTNSKMLSLVSLVNGKLFNKFLELKETIKTGEKWLNVWKDQESSFSKFSKMIGLQESKTMKLTANKIRLLIRESVRQVLNEASQEEIEMLDDKFQMHLGKSIQAQEAGNQAEADKQYELAMAVQQQLLAIVAERERLKAKPTKTKEPEVVDRVPIDKKYEPLEGYYDVVPTQSAQLVSSDQPEIVRSTPKDAIDITHGDPTMSRRDFFGGLAATAAITPSIMQTYDFLTRSDPRLKIASDWFDQQFASGKFARYYDLYIASKQFGTSMFSNFDSSSTTEKQAMIFDYITDFSPEELFEGLSTQWEKAGHQDPYEFNETEVMEQMDKLIEKKLKEYYTEEYITGLRNPLTVTYEQLAKMKDPQVEYYVYNYVNMEFEYSFADISLSSESAIEDIADEITDKMIHQLLEDENAGETREYDKLYDYLYDYVEGAVGVRAYHEGG